MSQPTVSLHPYFKVQPDQIEAARALLPQFVERTATEAGCCYYGFTMDGDEVFCREAYVDATSLLAHLENVGDLLGAMLQVASLDRLEIHGPAEELEKLKVPLADLKPRWFVSSCELDR